jgi:spore coat protein U-like protein
MKRSVKFAIVTLAVSMFSIPMFAVTVNTTNNNNVSATVVGSCRWFTPLTMAFPNYDPFAVAPTTQSATVNFKCVKMTQAGDTYKVWFSKTGGNMLNGANLLAYTLTDSLGAALGTTIATAATVAGVPGISGLGYSYTVNGSIAINQDVPVGAYLDTVVANIEY